MYGHIGRVGHPATEFHALAEIKLPITRIGLDVNQ